MSWGATSTERLDEGKGRVTLGVGDVSFKRSCEWQGSREETRQKYGVRSVLECGMWNVECMYYAL